MGDMTQIELAEKYRVSPSFVSLSLRGTAPTGKKQGEKRMQNLYDEKTAAAAIIRDLKIRADKKRDVYEEARKQADYAEGVMRANGLIDNPRWKL